MNNKPLSGIKVVELTTFVAASTAGRFLADWGAEVIKVETLTGDTLRGTVGKSWGVPEMWRTTGHDVGFDLANWNKKFVSINLKSAEGMAFLKKMIAGSDIFITSYRQKALEGMGLDYKTLSAEFPTLVYGHLIGYGEKGPDKDLPGYEGTTYFSRGGLYNCLRQSGGTPPNFMGAFGDSTTGAYLCTGLCAALVNRKVNGKGDRVVVSLLSSALFATAYAVEQQLLGVQSYPRDRTVDNNPFLNTYEASDGKWLMVNLPLWAKTYNPTMKCLGLDDMIDHPVYSNQVMCITQGKKAELTKIISDAFRKKTADEWVSIFHAADLSVEKHYSPEDIVNDEQVWANDFLVEREYPDGEKLAYVQGPVRFDSIGTVDFVPTGEIGRDTREYLVKYGYSEEQIEKLRNDKAVRMA